MAEYIDRTKIKYPKVDSPKGEYWDRFVTESYINSLPAADVIERSEYDKVVKNIDFLSQLNRKNLDTIFELRSKIDKAIEEIADIQSHIQLKDNTTNEYWIFVDKFDVLEILKRNIGGKN